MKLFLKYRAHLSRTVLLIVFFSFTYVVTRESYNFAHWIPHRLLRNAGISYETLLWSEQNADVFLHFVGGFVITILLMFSNLPLLKNRHWLTLLLVCGLCFFAEVFQYLIGRGKETSDLLLGICGSFMAYLAVNRKK